MKDPGGSPPKKPKGVPVDYKFPPKRTPGEWRRHMSTKLRQYEVLAWDFGKKGRFNGGGE